MDGDYSNGIPLVQYTSTETCDKAPAGWHCTRFKGHDGPCAAEEDFTEYLAVDRLFALRNRRSTNNVWGPTPEDPNITPGMRITDLGRRDKGWAKATVFTFDGAGKLVHVDRWLKGKWLLRGLKRRMKEWS